MSGRVPVQPQQLPGLAGSSREEFVVVGEREANGSAPVVGYTAGVFDLFHVGHLNLLRNARGMCDHLVVGVTDDELATYKGRRPVVPFAERAEIVGSVRFVDAVVQQADMNKFGMWERLRFDRIFVGDDWWGTPTWEAYETQFSAVGVSVVYFPYTAGTSSTLILERLASLEADRVPD